MRPSALLSLLLVAALAATRDAQVAPRPPAPVMPKAGHDVLNDKWPGWQVAAIEPSTPASLTGAATSPALVQADFDSDGHADLAAAVATTQGVRLVAMMSREWGYTLYDLDALGDKAAAAVLRVERRGTKFLRPPLQVMDFFSDDTLATYTCGGHTAYPWNGRGFDKIPLTQ